MIKRDTFGIFKVVRLNFALTDSLSGEGIPVNAVHH